MVMLVLGTAGGYALTTGGSIGAARPVIAYSTYARLPFALGNASNYAILIGAEDNSK
jgi:hypothetical protein